ncbi:hypothetical protein LJB92_00025 [Bacteroidales bacterium OttesenSCG-928-M06]|nr:hypothetical protein [Bacteroidales bacterium OttesenSCG-928-M06]
MNTVKNDGAYEKMFTSQKEFDKYFGKAATMSSLPTSIDFEKEFVGAFIAPQTDRETTIIVDSVIWNGKKTEIWLSMKVGDKMSYAIRPVKMLLIDKQYNRGLTSFVTNYEINESEETK